MTPDEVQNEIDDFSKERENTVNPFQMTISWIYRLESQKSRKYDQNPVPCRRTLQSPRGGHCNVLQEDTNSNI